MRLKISSLSALLPLLFCPTVSAQNVIPVSSSAGLTSALNTVQEGDVIELAPGVYAAPSGGWFVGNPSGSFTVRGQAGQTITLDGQSARPIFQILNASPGRTVLFQNLTFANGRSSQDGIGGGVTLSEAEASFVDCTFTNNVSVAPSTGGGGLAVFEESRAHVFRGHFVNNRARNEAGALKVGGGSEAFVHDSEFEANRVNIQNHRPSAAGGAIHVGNSDLFISNSRFDSNEAGCLAGALYAIGDFAGGAMPSSRVSIVNSTFVDNLVESNGVTCNFSLSGGGFHLEDEVETEVYNSRFLTNEAENGGAFSLYRSKLTIEGSVFRGNKANGEDSQGNGGTIAASSQDSSSDTANHPSAEIVIRNSFIQGRYAAVPHTGTRGGCIWTLGDTNRTFGLQGVPQMGTPAVNRTVLDIAGSVFFDCDVVRQEGVVGSGVGGAISASHTALTLDDSLIVDSDATGTNAAGGGIRAINDSRLILDDSTFANNRAELRGAALNVSGSEVQVDGCQFLDNDLISGTSGSAMALSAAKNVIAGSIDLGASGFVRNSVFSGNDGVAIRDQDFDCDGEIEPINTIVYNNNEFFTSPPDGTVFTSTVGGSQTASGLDALVINRILCSNTNKSTIDNDALSSEPNLVKLVAAPTSILPVNASGDPSPPTEAFLGYAWLGNPGTLDGSPLGSETGFAAGSPGGHTLVSGGSSDVATITSGPNPAATFTATPSSIDGGSSSQLEWSTDAGTFHHVSIDRGVEIPSPSANGSRTVSPEGTRTYRLHLVTEQGGVEETVTVFVDEVGEIIFADGFESGNTGAW